MSNPHSHPGGAGGPFGLLLLGACLLVSGCANTLGDDRYSVAWLLTPLLFWGVAAYLWSNFQRRRQLRTWDLRQAPTCPAALPLLWPLLAGAGGLALVFSVLHFVLDGLDGGQVALNLGAWALGTGVGTTVGSVLGFAHAHRSTAQGAHHG